MESASASTNNESMDRTLKPSWVFALAVGSEIGWGAFILPFDWLQAAGLGGVMVGFAVASVLILLMGLVYAYAIRSLPVTGGGVMFALVGAGRLPGFVAGWALALGYMGIVALNASAVALVFRVTFPNLLTNVKLYSVAGWDVYLPEVIVAILFIIAFSFLNSKGFAFSGRFQFWAVAIMLTAITIVVASMVYTYATGDITLEPAFPEDRSKIAAVFAILAIAPWAYIGFDSIPQLAGEFNFKPAKVVGLLVAGILAATAVYVTMTVATAIAVGNETDKFAGSAWPPAEAITQYMGHFGLILMALAVTAGVLTGLNGFIASSSRVLWTMGNADMIPSVFSKLSKKSSVPVYSIAAVGIVCAITPWFGRAALGWVVDMTSAGITIAYFFASFFLVRATINKVDNDHLAEERNSTWGAVLGVAGCLIAIFFLSLLLIPSSPGALGKESLIALVAWVILGAILFFSKKKDYYENEVEDLINLDSLEQIDTNEGE